MSSELDPQARALIGLALQGEQRLPRHRERVRRGVLAALAAPAALGATDAALAAGKTATLGAAASTGAKAALLGMPLVKAVPLVILGVAASVVGLKQIQSPARQHATAASVVAPAVSGAVAATPRAAIAPTTEIATADDAAPAESAALPKATRAAPPSGLESLVAPPTPPSLAAELEALQRAQRALNAGNASGALLELRTVTGQALRAERTALEVFAHCALGNAAAARKQAMLFRKMAPHSPLLPRVEASCAHD